VDPGTSATVFSETMVMETGTADTVVVVGPMVSDTMVVVVPVVPDTGDQYS